MLFKDKDKKAVSVMIGYVLLITFAVVMGIVVYSWMKTYVPKETLACPDGVSIFVKDYSCSSTDLSITLKNKGKFDIGGYIIRVANTSDAEIATIDLSDTVRGDKVNLNPGIKFLGNENSFSPNDEVQDEFDLTGIGEIYLLEVIPLRYQEQGRINRLVLCEDSFVRESLSCE